MNGTGRIKSEKVTDQDCTEGYIMALEREREIAEVTDFMELEEEVKQEEVGCKRIALLCKVRRKKNNMKEVY